MKTTSTASVAIALGAIAATLAAAAQWSALSLTAGSAAALRAVLGGAIGLIVMIVFGGSFRRTRTIAALSPRKPVEPAMNPATV